MDDLRERVEAVERALTDGEGDLAALADGAATADRVEALEADVEAIEADLAELDAAAQALKGYVGNIRSVNESVEDRAEAALATVEALEERVDALEDGGLRDAGSTPHCRRRGRPGSSSDDDRDRTGQTGRVGRSVDQSTCRVCGRPEPDRATANHHDRSVSDIATPQARHAGGGSQSPGRTSSVDATTRRETIGGFDLDAGVDRGSPAFRRDDAIWRPARPATDGGSRVESGLLGRLRELL